MDENKTLPSGARILTKEEIAQFDKGYSGINAGISITESDPVVGYKEDLAKVIAERDQLAAKVAALTNAINHMPLVARWHHGNGVLVCGTVRVAREDFDTDPSEHFRTSFWNNVCNVMNAAAQFRNADLSAHLGEPVKPVAEWNPTNTQKAMVMGVTGTPEQQEEARRYFSHYQDLSSAWFRKLIKEL